MPDIPDNTSDYHIVCVVQEDGSQEFTIRDFAGGSLAIPAEAAPAYPIGYSRHELFYDWQRMMRAFSKPVVVMDADGRVLESAPA